MTAARRLGLIGGTFDPIHYGHLDAAAAALTAARLDEVLFIPAHDPPHKPTDPRATAFQRFALVALAIAGEPRYRVSDMELVREGPSFTVDTLRALHAQGWSASELFFIIGADAFADIGTWRAYPTVLDLANFVVVQRPAVGRVPHHRESPDVDEADLPHGRARGATSIHYVDARTRDVSSTTIRARLASGLPIDDLVPPVVARHILVHHLYGATVDSHGEKHA